MNHNNFSEFAEQIVNHPHMRTVLYHLQDRLGMNVNILLFCCWFAYKGCRHLSKKDLQSIANTISPWHNQIVTELQKMLVVSNRMNDQYWQTNVGAMILNAELLANQMEQTMLAEIIDRPPINRTSTQKIADACKSVSAYSKELKGGFDQEDAEAIKQLLIHIFPDTDYANLTTYWGNSSINKRHEAFSHLQLPLSEM
jgi:uncharacterized protein (TIGR02444 family)